MRDLRAREHAVARRIADRVNDGLPDLLTRRSPGWRSSLRELLAPLTREARSDPGPGQPPGAPGFLQRSLDQGGRDISRDWLSRRAAEVHELIIGIAAGDIGALLELARSPPALGAGISGLAGVGGPAGWSAEDVPALAVRPVEWSIAVRPPRRAHRRTEIGDDGIPQWLAHALDEAITGYEGRARDALQDAARRWASQLRDQAERQAAEAG